MNFDTFIEAIDRLDSMDCSKKRKQVKVFYTRLSLIDIVRRIGKIEKIENPVYHYHGDEIDFIHYFPDTEYTPNIDHFFDTDEYKEKFCCVFIRIMYPMSLSSVLEA